jgi:exodeoxyribonuclease V alpha subunit
MEALLEKAVEAGALRAVDLQLARRLGQVVGAATPEQLLAAALASRRTGAGDVCVDLGAVAGTAPFEALPELTAPALEDWREALSQWPAVATAGPEPIGPAPLVLAGNRLYLGRYWAFERSVAERIAALAADWVPGVDRARLREGLRRLFARDGAAADADEPDLQQLAAAVAVLKRLSVISGGPGTGKTYTVTAILALLLEQAGSSGRLPRIALAAPTGKAAARLTESIRQARGRLPLPPGLAESIPDQAQTLHRLLGSRPGRTRPRHHAGAPLHLDVLVLDEASMIDLPLMARLLDALPARARLILLGDRDQLASVESGMVLGDLCGRGRALHYSADMRAALAEVGVLTEPAQDAGGDPSKRQLDLFGATAAPPAAGPADSIVLLRRSWRFRGDSGIGALAAAVNAGDAAGVRSVLEASHPDVRHLELDESGLRRLIREELVPRHGQSLASGVPADVLAALGRWRVLCAVRDGAFGVAGINRMMELALESAGVIRRDGAMHYAGRPLMVTRNDYGVGLYNGDVGIVLRGDDAVTDTAGDGLRAWFEGDDGPRRVLTGRLPAAETVFAMTVHKAQGSEYDEVYLILPPHESRAATRELLYTGITRTRGRVTLITPIERLLDACARPVSRLSGLYEALWPRPDAGV